VIGVPVNSMAKAAKPKGVKDSSELPLPNPHGRWTRLAFTIAPFIVYLLAERITLPGIDAFALERAGGSSATWSIVALGIMPWITAAVLVEIAAVVIPWWQHLRHGGVVGRAKLQRATNILGLIFSVFQAFSMTTLLQPASYTTLITLVAGAILTKLLAEMISRRGLANGYGVFFVGTMSLASVRTFLGEKQLFGWVDGLGVFVKIVACAALTWFVLTKLRPAQGFVQSEKQSNEQPRNDDSDNPYAAPGALGSSSPTDARHAQPIVWQLPTVASGLLPYSIVSALVLAPAMFYDSIPGVAALQQLLRSGKTSGIISLSLLFACTWICTWLFNQPKRVAKVYARLSTSNVPVGRIAGEVQEASRHAFAHALVFLFGVAVIDLVTRKVTNLPLGTENLVFAVVLCLDIAKEFRTLASRRDLVSVWPEHRPYAIAAARAALESEGILVHVRNEHQKRLFQFTVPYIPMEIFVPQKDAVRAAKILNDVLLESPERVKQNIENSPIVANRRPLQTWVVAIIALFSVGAVGLSWPIPKPEVVRGPRTTKLEFVLIDDDYTIFDDNDMTNRWMATKSNVELQQEQVPQGVGKTAVRAYAYVRKADHETLNAARIRLETWAKAIKLPEGGRVAIGEYQTYDEVQEKIVTIGWRAYLLKGAAILTEKDVAKAQAMPNPSDDLGAWIVRLEFTADGAQRFEKATEENIKRRFAIVLDGVVQSAPVIQSKIPGGVATISMGGGSTNHDQQRIDAQNLEKALNGY
jgi:hypothetical protein